MSTCKHNNKIVHHHDTSAFKTHGFSSPSDFIFEPSTDSLSWPETSSIKVTSKGTLTLHRI